MDRSEARSFLESKRRQIQGDAAARAAQRPRYGSPLELHRKGAVYRGLWYQGARENAPLYIDIHGGGFCWGRVDDGDGFCHRVTARLGWTAVSLDYPLTPEACFPEPVEWLYSAYELLISQTSTLGFDDRCILVGGRSAGANLAAALCMAIAERNGSMPAGHVLDHPFLDLVNIEATKDCYSGPHTLAPDLLEALASLYATDAERTLPTCSPLLASDELIQKMPPAVIQTCEWDSLRRDGERYALRLQDVGVPVQYHCFPGVYHGFTEFSNENQTRGQDWLIEHMAHLL